jgi:chromosome segregation ATPase
MLREQITRTETTLREQIARAERDLADERMTIASLAEQLDHARVAADDHLQQIAAARENIEALVAELEIARVGAYDQQQQLDAARDHIDALTEEIAVARVGAESRQVQIESLVASLEDRSRQVIERERREAALRNDMQRLSEEAGALRSERDALAPALRETQEATAALSADRDRLVQLERGARERGALLDGRITALQTDVQALRSRDEANSAELARLSRTWYGRLARRLARRR